MGKVLNAGKGVSHPFSAEGGYGRPKISSFPACFLFWKEDYHKAESVSTFFTRFIFPFFPPFSNFTSI
jgi:hypothetical protein